MIVVPWFSLWRLPPWLAAIFRFRPWAGGGSQRLGSLIRLVEVQETRTGAIGSLTLVSFAEYEDGLRFSFTLETDRLSSPRQCQAFLIQGLSGVDALNRIFAIPFVTAEGSGGELALTAECLSSTRDVRSLYVMSAHPAFSAQTSFEIDLTS